MEIRKYVYAYCMHVNATTQHIIVHLILIHFERYLLGMCYQT